jgi:hypothetical protein
VVIEVAGQPAVFLLDFAAAKPCDARLRMNQTPPLRDRLPEGVVNLADYERLAEQHLDPNAWAYFSVARVTKSRFAGTARHLTERPLMPRMLNGGHRP